MRTAMSPADAGRGVVVVGIAPRRIGVKRRASAAETVRRARAARGGPVLTRRSAAVACTALLVVEAVGSLLLWVPVPLAWLWIGGRVYAATSSLSADVGVAFFGFVATTFVAMAALGRIDRVWVALRRRAGHDPAQGALAEVMVVVATLGIVLFLVWFYVIQRAFVIPFMPSR